MYVYTIAFTSAVGGLLFGFDTGVISGTMPFVSEHFNLNAYQEGFAVSNLIIGCILGAIFTGGISDRFGRKKILILAGFLFTLSAILSGLPRTFTELIVARFIGGLAVGAASVISPLYISEISPARIRGRLVSLNQLTIVIGILLTYFSNWLLVDTGPNNWRYMFVCEAVPAGLFICALFFVPESPRWLAKKGRFAAALAILSRVNGASLAEQELEEIRGSLNREEGHLSELLHPGMRRILVVTALLAFFSQITGIDSLVYYAPKIFLQAGFESVSSAYLASIVVGVTLLIFTVVALFTVDTLGRKPLLLIGFFGMGFSMFFAGYAFNSTAVSPVWLVVAIVSFLAFFAVSVGPIPWVYISEVFPTKIRGSAASFATMILWSSNFIVAQSFPWMVENLGGRSFYLFGAISGIAFLFILAMLTETKGKTLEEIESMWEGAASESA